MADLPRVLLIEDNPAEAELLAQLVGGEVALTRAGSLGAGVEAVASTEFDVVLLDLSLPDSAGLDTVRLARSRLPALPVIVLTGLDSLSLGLEAVRAGAQDYLVKGKTDAETILRAVRYAIERDQVRRELERFNERLEVTVRRRTADLAQAVDTLKGEVEQRMQAEQALRRSNEELASLAAQLRALAGELTLVEQHERRRMARVLHDHLQQLLAGAKFRVAILSRVSDAQLQQVVREVENLLEEAIRESRSLTAELSPPILNDGTLATGLEWLVQWMADRHALVVELDAEADLPDLAQDLKVLLFESVRELLFNTAKHSQVRSATVTVRSRDGQVHVVVSDRGVGFEPKSLTGPTGRGGGFGLFSLRERLSLVGGRLAVDSAPGCGTRMTITAPAGADFQSRHTEPTSEAAKSPRDPVPSQAPAGRRLRVLLADDHAVVRQGLARLLSQEPDIEVVGEACDGQMAIDLSRRLKPDVILMDLGMPHVNGVEATAIIHREQAQIHIVGLSMFEQQDRAATMLAAGAGAYLSKSSPAARVIAAVRAGRPAAPPA